MKKQLTKIAKDGRQFNIVISLDDECNNGHQDFSITGTIYKDGGLKIERNIICSGAIGDFVVKEFPDLEIFERLHLCDYNGAPMYAAENGFYYVKRMSTLEFCRYFRCSEQEFEKLKATDDIMEFSISVYRLGITKRWKEEAEQAIMILEKMTGEKWVNDSIKSYFVNPTNDDIADFEKKEAEGYYSDEQKKQRINERQKTEYEKNLAKLKIELDKRIKKAQTEYEVSLAVLNAGLSLKNFIFYSHTNVGSFNWLDYEDKITREQFNEFVKNTKIDGVKFTFKP